MDPNERLRWVVRLRACVRVLMLPYALLAGWIGLKYVMGASSQTGLTVVLICLAGPVALICLVEYLGHLKGKFSKQSIWKVERSHAEPETQRSDR